MYLACMVRFRTAEIFVVMILADSLCSERRSISELRRVAATASELQLSYEKKLPKFVDETVNISSAVTIGKFGGYFFFAHSHVTQSLRCKGRGLGSVHSSKDA